MQEHACPQMDVGTGRSDPDGLLDCVKISIRISAQGFVRQKLIPTLRIGTDWPAAREMPCGPRQNPNRLSRRLSELNARILRAAYWARPLSRCCSNAQSSEIQSRVDGRLGSGCPCGWVSLSSSVSCISSIQSRISFSYLPAKSPLTSSR